MNYESTLLKPELIVDKIITIHYFEYSSHFIFPGEAHDFWEFLYVDKGTVDVMAGSIPHTLNKGDIIFHQPNEFHSVTANGKVAPNLVVISFECYSPAMDFFRERILKLGTRERELLGLLIKEAKNAFLDSFGDPFSVGLNRKEPKEVPFGSEQCIQMYLQQFLILLVRNGLSDTAAPFLPTTNRMRSDEEIFRQVITYLEKHLDSHLTIPQICHDNHISRSLLLKLFRQNTQTGVIDYFCHLKIDAARQMIREGGFNFTQISDTLGYSSIHYFSRQFKLITGMTPTEYASSVKSLSEN